MCLPKWLSIIISVVIVLALGYLGYFYYYRYYSRDKKIERTLAIIKPDAVAAKCTGKIIDKIEQEGFKIISLKKMNFSKELAEKFYEELRDRLFFKELVDFMTCGPSIVMILERENAIKAWRDLMGPTNPKDAREGTLRKLYGTNINKNAVHGSDAPESAQKEIALLFQEIK
jgi:nucleoside-diphosphate kinase